jgi:hypothetical protein
MTTYHVRARFPSIKDGGTRSAMYNIGENGTSWTVGTVMAFPNDVLDYFDTHGNSIPAVPEWHQAVEDWRAANPEARP